jgi:phosphoribosylamine--glycine ligase
MLQEGRCGQPWLLGGQEGDMKVLVVGSGGREHALCWAIAGSPLCERLYCTPGNAGIMAAATCGDVAAEDIDGIVAYAQEKAIDLVVVGPEAPLVAGLVDRLEEAGIRAFGPSAAASVLEASKAFTKDFCIRHRIPTGGYASFTDADAARAYVREQGAPLVVKADGLAAGKGVVIAHDTDAALAAIDEMMVGRAFGDSGTTVVIEEFLDGEEASFFVLVDGENVLPLASAQDHKAVGEGDTGPNTGGMGAYSPAPVMTEALTEQVMETIIRPTVSGMADEGRPFRGVLFAGLMIVEGQPLLLEYNIRFGDPECQVLMVRLQSDILPAMVAACEGALEHFNLRWRNETAMVVVMAANGYPGAYEKGSEIKGLDVASEMSDTVVFHAGTAEDGDRIIATGGRVLGIAASGDSVADAQTKAYAAVNAIDWPGGFCRRDIGWRAVGREIASD